MFLVYIYVIAAVIAVNFALSIIIIAKMHKQEKFHTNEAHANLELINQSLNRLSDIAEKLEKVESPTHGRELEAGADDAIDQKQNKSREQRAISLIRQGEDPRKIGRKLGISRSELELLIASEKLGNARFTNMADARA